MLSALLPGVREFRTPLVVGLLWAVSAWLVVGGLATDSIRDADLADRFADLHLPVAAGLSALLLAAYILGSLLVVRKSPIGWLMALSSSSSASPSRHWTEVETWLTNRFLVLAESDRIPVMWGFGTITAAMKGFEGFYDRTTLGNDGTQEQLKEHFRASVLEEEPAVEVRIQMKFPELYSEIDRIRGEGELRLSLFWPLVTLALTFGCAWTWWTLLTIPVALILWADGSNRMRQAIQKTWAPVVAGEVKTPILEAMESAPPDEALDYRQRKQRIDDQIASLGE